MKMKSFKAVSAAVICVLMTFASCGNQSEDAAEPTTEKTVRVASTPIDEQIIGIWSNGTSGYEFTSDHDVSLIMDYSSLVKFNADGSVTVNGTVIPKEDVTAEGNTVSIVHKYEEFDEPVDVMELEKLSSSGSGFDGEYLFTGGDYKAAVAVSLGVEADSITLKGKVDGDSFILTAEAFCKFETNNGVLELFGEDMNYVDSNATSVKYTYSIDGDELKLTYEDLGTEVYQRQKQEG